MEKKAYLTSGAGITGYQHVEIENRPISISTHKTQIQVDQRPQHKTSHSEPYRRESGKYT